MPFRIAIAAGLLFTTAAFAASAQAQNGSCHADLRNVDQLFGIQVQIGLAFATRPLGTPANRAAILGEAARIPANIHSEIARLTRGATLGFTAPRNNVERVVAQLDAMQSGGDASAVNSPIARDADPDFARQWHTMIADSVAPALDAYRHYLADSYLAQARPEPSLSTLPGGRACYAELMRQNAGVTTNNDSLYASAVRARLELIPELRKAAAQLLGPDVSLTDALLRIRTDPEFVMQNPDSILAAYTQKLASAREKIRPLFSQMPEAPLDIRAIPASQAASQAPARYQQASAASGHAVFYVNSYLPGGVARMNIALGAAHEGYPGHHFQFLYTALWADSSGQRAGQRGGAYTEGWGIYAERLADEAGLYDSPMDRFGYLVHLMDVFVGLQGDIGMHDRGWTRQAVIDTMMAVAGRPRAQAESYADRHAATPGQLASYGIGYFAIMDARAAASHALGSRFSEPVFHDAVLLGPGSLPEMRARVDAWVRKAQAQ